MIKGDRKVTPGMSRKMKIACWRAFEEGFQKFETLKFNVAKIG